MAQAASQDPDQALRLHARDELGVDPSELPSGRLAGAASFVAFSLGALLPLLPYLLGIPLLAVSLLIAGVVLTAGGMVVGKLTGRPMLRSGLRQLLLGAASVAITYGIGHLIGTAAA
jgi:VIT1/CCC1 family predicted Fe2+/Mn2+ transporter